MGLDSDDLDDLDGLMPELPIDEMMAGIFLGYDPKLFAERLALLNDGLPLPQVFSWEEENEDDIFAVVGPEGKRTLAAFKQIVLQERKSGKYLQAMRELCAAHPDSELLAMILLNYLSLWEPDEYRSLGAELTAAHPDWLTLRFSQAGGLLLDLDPTAPDPAGIEAFLDLLEHKLELHQHLEVHPQVVVGNSLVITFYVAVAAYHILKDHFARAIYCLNLADAAGAEALDPMMSQLLMRLLTADQLESLRTFLEPLRQDRERRWEEADKAENTGEED